MKMNGNTLIMGGIFLVLVGLCSALYGGQGIMDAAKASKNAVKHIWLLLFFAIGIAGLLQVLIPQEVVSNLLGPSSGLKGLLAGWACGAVMPGAPYTVLPVAASLLKSGSGIGPIMTMVVSSSIGIALTRIPYEVAFVGWRFVAVRVISGVALPLLAGGLASLAGRWIQIGGGAG